MKEICIYASDLAVITGHNTYQTLDELMYKLWERNFRSDYMECITSIQSEGQEVVQETKQDYIQRITKEYNIEDAEKMMEECLKAADVKELETKQQKILTSLKDIPKHERKLLKECIKSETNTNFGTRNENIGLNEYKNQTGENVKQLDRFFKKSLYKTKRHLWSLGGRIDGINETEDTIIEIKNRVKRLFYNLRDYEKIQVYAYMYILNVNDSRLVECYKEGKTCDINIIDIPYEISYWKTEIDTKIQRFIKQFERFLKSNELKKQLITKLFVA